MSEPAPPSGTSQTSGGVSDNEGAGRRMLDDGGGTGDGNTSAASGAVSRTSAGTSNTGVTSGASTTTISTIAVQSGNTRIVLALLQSGEWLELRVVELSPGLVYLGSTLEEASALQQAHHEVLTKLQSKQSPVEDLLNQADQLISTQKPRAEVYAAMAESLGLAWRDLNSHLETRKTLLDMSVAFHTRARQYSNALDAAEKIYTDNVMPSDAEGARQLLTALHDHKRNILESSMFTLQEAHMILSRLRGLLQEGGTMDSRPQHIKINIEFACSQIEHYLESLHDRRRFLDGLFMTRKHHLEQCLALCLLYQDLTEAIMNLKKLRDDISANQDLGASQANSEILLHEHLRRESTSKAQQDQCVRHVRTAEQMVESGHYAGAEARARAYSVLEAATALHETCDTRTALLQQAALFFRLANAALTKLDQAEVQVAGLNAKGGNQRLSIVMGVVEEAIQPALAEGYALLEVTGGRGQTHNEGITDMVEQLENRRTRLSSLCASSTEEVLQRTELINSFLEMYNSIESWLVRIGDSFLQGHQDPGGSVSLAKDFLHLHLTLRSDLIDKNQEINSLSSFLDQLSQELSEEELSEYRDKVDGVRNHWNNLEDILDSRIKLSERYVKFHEDAELIQLEFEGLENQLKAAASEADNRIIDEKWRKIQNMFLNLDASGKKFIQMANESEYPYLDINRAILSVESILESLAKRKLVITDLHSHYQMKISINKELTVLWNTYKENLKKMETEMQNLEDCFCPLLRGDSSDPEGMGSTLETRLNAYVKAIKLIQEDIENMVTKAEGMSYSDNLGAERPEILRALLQLYQNLQNKTTDYQILGTMLIQWCKNIAEVHRSCDKLEKQFGVVYVDPGSVEGQLREHEASKHAVFELLKFAQHEADAIVQKIRVQCPREPGSKDIARIKDMLQRRKKIMEENWTERQTLLERQLKRSHYQVDLKLISDQLRDLSDQLTRMQGHFGDSLNTALNMRTAFNQFKLTVELLERRIQNFVSTAEKMLKADDDSRDIQLEIAELQKKWSTFHMQVGDSQKSIEISIKFFKLVQEAEDWFKDGSQLLITVAGESSQIKNPDQALKLRQRIESFLTPGQQVQANRINQISSLAIQLYGDSTPQQQLQVEAVSQQNQYMLESFNVINKNLTELLDNLREAEEQRYKQEKEQQELAASLALAQAEAEAARLAAADAAEEARRVAEEAAKALAAHKIISESHKVEVVVQTESFTSHEEEEPAIEEPQHLPPMFLTPLLGAAVTEGVKFTFECRVTGLPKPDVIWLKDGLSIMSNPDYGTSFDGEVCTLTIEETFTEDSAVFTCRAVNLVGTAESSANLIVKESAPTEIMSPPSFVKRLVDSMGQEGSSFQLEATVTGHPLPVVSWTKNGNCIDNSPDYIITFNNGECILRFEELFLEDEAEYVCKASNDIGEDLTKAKLSVKATVASEKPSFPVPLSNLMARAGQKFKLECQVNGSPTPSLAWFHNSKPVKETSECKITFDGKVASLVISEAFPKNAGCYALVAKNTAGEAQTSSNVSVKGRIPTETSDSELASDIDVEPIKPSVQQSLKDIVTTEGQAIRLDCIIVGQPEPEVIWYHDEKPVKESEDFRLLFHGDRCSLVIQEAFLEDAGMYKVVAMNSAGETSTSCSVAIQAAPEKVPSPLPPPELITAPLMPPTVAPRFSELLVDTHVIEGQPVTLTACAHGSPKPTIAWFRDRVPLLPDDQLQMWEEPEGFVKVYIPRSTPIHTGQYEVVASNSVGTAKCISFLSVELRLPTPPPEEPKEPPVFTKLLQDIAKKAGDSVLFEAEVTGKPKPSVHWTLNDSPISGQEYLHGERQYILEEVKDGRYTLSIPTVNKGQDGRISVIAENDAGKSISACHFRVVDPPQPAPVLISAPETFERRTIISETHVSKFVSSSTSDEGPTKQSYATSTTSHISSATGQPTVEVHGSRIQQIEQEGFAPPKVSDKVSYIKLEGEKVIEEVCEDTSSVAPFSLPIKKPIIKRKSVPARFIAPLQGVILHENDKAVFECCIEGYPEPSITWNHNGNLLPEEASTSVELNRLTLVIPRVSQQHSGRYTCCIDNEAGSAQCTCDLVVRKKQFPPVFSKRIQPTVIGVGERLHLEVDISGTPPPEIQWTKNNQPLQSVETLLIKSEGTRNWLVIPEAKQSDSGRYGVSGTNSAGKAESIADVLITNLVASEPPLQKVIFSDISDDTRNQTEFVEAGRVKILKRVIESTSIETQAPLPPSSFPKKISIPFLQHLESSSELPIPSTADLSAPSEVTDEVVERKLPGKLTLAWPPPPSEDEEEPTLKLDPTAEISKNKVSSIISTFSTVTEVSTPVIVKREKTTFIEKPIPETQFISLEPGPEPEYGFIADAAVKEEEIDKEYPPSYSEAYQLAHDREKSISPDIHLDEYNLPSSSEVDAEFSDNFLSTSVTSDYYPKTSPSLELENIERFQEINKEPDNQIALQGEILVDSIVEPDPENMEVKTEKHSKESSFTEIKKSITSSEKTIIETKIYRDYPKDEELEESVHVIPEQMKEEKHEEIIEYILPDREEVVEYITTEKQNEDIQDTPVLSDFIPESQMPKVSISSTQSDGKKFTSHTYSAKEKSYSSSITESQKSFVSKSEVETKVYPHPFDTTIISETFKPPVPLTHEISFHMPPITKIAPTPLYLDTTLASGTFLTEKINREDLTSGDESSKPPLPSDDSDYKQERKMKKKRESVRQIALRLEETIIPISPDEVPGGIRMFPPKPPTPIESPQVIPLPKVTPVKDDVLEEVKIEFPKLEPFPFVVEEKAKVEKPKIPPPAKPKKFIPGSFTDSEYESDFDAPIGDKFVPKKIKFEVSSTKTRTSSTYPEPPPPSFYDKLPIIEGMRPAILKKEEIPQPKIQKPVKDFSPRKQSKIVQKFLAQAGEKAAEEITKPKPPTRTISNEFVAKTSEEIVKTISTTEMSSRTEIQKDEYEDKTILPKKITKIWPPPEEPVISPVLDELQYIKSIVSEERFGMKAPLVYQEEQEEVLEMPPVEPQIMSYELKQEIEPQIIPEPVVKPEFIVKQLEPVSLSKTETTIETSTLIQSASPMFAQSQVTQKGFKSVRPPSPALKKIVPTSTISPAPPFDIAPPVIPTPEIQQEKPIYPSQKFDQKYTPKVSHKTSTSMEKKSFVYEKRQKDTSLQTQTKSVVSSKKVGTSWPPKMEETTVGPLWDEVRSQSLERPAVMEPPVLPIKSHEAPPSIYWSSNITLKEKRSSLPLAFYESPPIISAFKQDLISKESMVNAYGRVESSFIELQKPKIEKSVPKHVRIEEPVKIEKPVMKSALAQRRPTPAPYKTTQGLSSSLSAIQSNQTRQVEPVEIGYKPIPEPEPFPFEVPQVQEKHRIRVPPPPKPTKFVPGSFTESDYESDYEGKPPSIWRPYMSDTETSSYRPIEVNLRQGRHRRSRAPSPPAPSEFDTPSKVVLPLRPASSLPDFESEVVAPKRKFVTTSTATQSKLQKKDVTFKPKTHSTVIPTYIPKQNVKQESKDVGGVRSLKGKFQETSRTSDFQAVKYSPRGVPAPQIRSPSPSLGRGFSLSPSTSPSRPALPRMLTPAQSHESVIVKQDFVSSSMSKQITASSPALSQAPIKDKIIPIVHESFQTKEISVPKPLSPKSRKKVDVSMRLEESGYTADTEATLPRKNIKPQAYHESSSATSSSYSKSETHVSSFSSVKSESKSFQSQHSSLGKEFKGFPGDVFSGSSDGFGFPPGNGIPPGSFSFPTHPSHTVDQSTRDSSSFASSENKTSQIYSSTKSEEHFEKHSTASEDKKPDGKKTEDKKSEDKRQQEHRQPKHEEFRRETRGTPHSYGPFSEDTFYSMRDESDETKDGSRKKSKVEIKTESHVQVMSDKKSEYYSYSSGDNLDKPQRESPKLKKKKISKPSEIPEIHIKTTTPIGHGKHKVQVTEKVSETKVREQVTVPAVQKMKSIGLVQQEIIRQEKEKDSELKPFPFEPEPEKFKKPKGTPPSQPTKFVKVEFRESDYGSDYERKMPPVWISPQSKVDETLYDNLKRPQVDKKLSYKEKHVTTPKIEFPDSEPESKESIQDFVRTVDIKHDIPKIIPKKIPIVKSQPTIEPAAPIRSPSPPLHREPTPEEGYMQPPPNYSPFSNAVGVESTKITKIEDSSQHHKRFVTMQQTTRVIKLSDSTIPKPKIEMPRQPKVFKKELPSIDIKPMPNLQPFPFIPEPSRPKRDRGPQPPTPKKFIMGEMRESDYDSDTDIRIKPKWQPPDSDAEEQSYAKVRVPKPVSKKPASKERTPTPPSAFETPPPTGEPMRPSIEPVDRIVWKEPSPEPIVPIEMVSHKKTAVVKVQPHREPSPPLPPPEPQPEERFMTVQTEYVVNGINVETKLAPPTMKPIHTFKQKPFREIIEKTERRITDKHYTEERKHIKDKYETVKTTITELKKDKEPIRRSIETKSGGLEEVSHLEPFPFEPEVPKPRLERGPPPALPKKFVKRTFSETSYDSDYEGKIPVVWRPSDSDTEEPSYSKMEVSIPRGRIRTESERTPTPPSKFDKGPLESEYLRPAFDISTMPIEAPTRISTQKVKETIKVKPIKKVSTKFVAKDVETFLPEPGPKPEILYMKPEPPVMLPSTVVKQDVSVQKESYLKKGIDIDIDIVDVYDYMSESETEKTFPEIGSFKSFPDLEPFPYSPEPERPKKERGQPPPLPKKFMKGEFRESDYEYDYEGRIPPKWGPTDSESEGPSFRKVQPPQGEFRKVSSEIPTKIPSPPMKFDHPPKFEGPPRPIVDLNDIPRRERRESLEEYSIPKFPKVEFKPFDLEEEMGRVHVTHTTDTETETEAFKQSVIKSTMDKRYEKTAQKFVGEQFGDMNRTFRDKAQKFAEQLVSEVFAAREGSEPPEPAGEPPTLSETLKPPADHEGKDKLEEGLGLNEPQAYRDESRLSEYGTRHIDPDTGLIYFKYDFGYEFGIILPGEGQKVDKLKKIPTGKQNGDIEIPVIHIKSDDEGPSKKGKVGSVSSKQGKPQVPTPSKFSLKPKKVFEKGTSDSEQENYGQYIGKVIPEFYPKRKAQFKPIFGDPYSDSEKEDGKKSSPHLVGGKFADANGTHGFIPLIPGATVHPHQQPLKDHLGVGDDHQLTSPGLVSSAVHSSAISKPPTFITPIKDASLNENDNLHLECIVKSDIASKVTWRKDGIPIKEDSRCKISFRNGVCRLNICQLVPGDSGHYTCTIENALGKDITASTVVVSPGEAS